MRWTIPLLAALAAMLSLAAGAHANSWLMPEGNYRTWEAHRDPDTATIWFHLEHRAGRNLIYGLAFRFPHQPDRVSARFHRPFVAEHRVTRHCDEAFVHRDGEAVHEEVCVELTWGSPASERGHATFTVSGETSTGVFQHEA